MSRINDLIQDLCPDGVKFQNLSNICSISIGEFVKKTKQDSQYPYPVYNGGATPTGYYDSHNSPENSVVISARGSIGFVNFVETKFWAGNSCYVVRPLSNQIEVKFIYYFLKANELNLYKLRAVGGIPAINLKPVEKFKIPVPPIEEQREIVSILDKFTTLEAELEAELEARKKQFSILRKDKFNRLINTSPILPLGDTVEHLRTGLNPRSNFVLNEPGSNCFYITVRELMGRSINPTSKTDLVTQDAITRINQRSRLKIGDVLFSGTGTIGKTALIETDPSSWNIKEGVYALTPNSTYLVSDYLLYLLQSDYVMDQIRNLSAGSTVNSISMESLKKVKLPVPDISTQKAISNLFLKFENLAEGIEFGLPAEIAARRKQYEYYRDKLLTFKELDAA